MLRVFQEASAKVKNVDMSGNSGIGRMAMIKIREFIEGEATQQMAFEKIDVSDCG
jgi:hypothetical protein